MKTQIETERRFLLKRVPNIPHDIGVIRLNIQQHYLSEVGADETERIRYTDQAFSDNSFYNHTIKTRVSDMSANEAEGEITSKEYMELIQQTKRSLEKTRFVCKVEDNLKWEIDRFDNFDLVIAEIELPSEDYDLQIPEWLEPLILMEITGMKQFSNSNLAE